MEQVEIIAIIGSLALLVIVVELVRERRLAEGYALLWLFTALVLLGLSIWRELLDVLARLVGIFYPPAALFVIGFGFVLLILLQFSVIISIRSQEQRELAQRVALLAQQLDATQRALQEMKPRAEGGPG